MRNQTRKTNKKASTTSENAKMLKQKKNARISWVKRAKKHN